MAETSGNKPEPGQLAIIIITRDLSFPKSRTRASSGERYSILQTIQDRNSREETISSCQSSSPDFLDTSPIPYFKTMHTFGRIENPESWCGEVEVLETARHAEQEKRVSALCEEGRERLEDLWRKLADAEYELAVINSPILILPYEVMAEIFNWHLLMGGTMMTILLICKRWATVAYSSPRLWSRIAVGDRCLGQLRLQGAIRCGDLDILRAVLSRARSSPLQLELSWFNFDTDHDPLYRRLHSAGGL